MHNSGQNRTQIDLDQVLAREVNVKGKRRNARIRPQGHVRNVRGGVNVVDRKQQSPGAWTIRVNFEIGKEQRCRGDIVERPDGAVD